ncbi:MAG: phosphoribosylformylglycinamidine synthase subunit PurQ [Candidatus Saccharicenans sp.]|nr:MAG: phosphoribosylformylglycinamidine synthase I [Candidatus Aminicenantes bacterium]HEK84963.1 phosphoribosylformylglycinamidine synthase subunit PurQ [Candidatus Aminicenantes bacterium]
MKFGVVVFPGSNCDYDTFHALQNVMGQETVFLWHKDHDLQRVDGVVLPGGFSYGDYLRSGAIARFSPIMAEVKKFAEAGGLVLGICNGFQILLEAGLLPGAMLRNKNLKFLCQHVHIRVENQKTAFTNAARKGQVLRIPIAHFDGNYYADPELLAELEKNKQIVFRYCNEKGQVTEGANVNGSVSNIAGIINREGNVLGLMPHPERASEKILGSEDGRVIFQSMINYLEKKAGRGKKKATKVVKPKVTPLPPLIGTF